MKESAITIPCHWNEIILEKIIKNNNSAITPVTEIYGALANGDPIGHGRSPDSVVSINKDKAKDFKQKCNQNKINFTYLLNAPFNESNNSESKKKVDEYLDWIIKDFQADALTISSHELMIHVRSRYPEIPIHISTIAGIKNLKELKPFLDVNPNRVVPHHDLGKRIKNLEELISFGDKSGIDMEVLATESCLFDCPNRRSHYEYLAKKTKDNPFHVTCNSKKITSPEQLLMAGGLIRPEDVQYYSDLGVSFFKISGRSKPADWLPEVVKAYQENNYRGNLIRLLGIDPTLEAEKWMFLENKSLEGFIRGFPQKNKEEMEDYCQKWISRLYSEGNFYLNDGTSYMKTTNENLVIDKIGNKVTKIISKEKYQQ